MFHLCGAVDVVVYVSVYLQVCVLVYWAFLCLGARLWLTTSMMFFDVLVDFETESQNKQSLT